MLKKAAEKSKLSLVNLKLFDVFKPRKLKCHGNCSPEKVIHEAEGLLLVNDFNLNLNV